LQVHATWCDSCVFTCQKCVAIRLVVCVCVLYNYIKEATISLSNVWCIYMCSVDRIRNILGFEPEYFIAFSYKDFMHPGDTEMMEQAHEFRKT
jgi:hypothetical protein